MVAVDTVQLIKMQRDATMRAEGLEKLAQQVAIKGANTAELLIMPGETSTLKWVPDRVGVFPFYCTDFCSALHQEMQGYLRVSPAGSNTPLTYSTGDL